MGKTIEVSIRPAGCMNSMTYWFRIIMAEIGQGMLKNN